VITDQAAGVDLNAINFCIGPMVKYWITNNIGAEVTYSAIGGFTGFGFRGIYEFSKEVKLADEKFNPFLAIGYSLIKKKDTYAGASLTFKGSGVHFSGGLEGNLKKWNPNLFYTVELIFIPFDLEAKYEEEVNFYGYTETETITAKSELSSFGIGFSITYYFNL